MHSVLARNGRAIGAVRGKGPSPIAFAAGPHRPVVVPRPKAADEPQTGGGQSGRALSWGQLVRLAPRTIEVAVRLFVPNEKFLDRVPTEFAASPPGNVA